MSWKTKMWFANAGGAFTTALMCMLAGNLLWVGFFILTGIYWQFGEVSILADEKRHSINPMANQRGE